VPDHDFPRCYLAITKSVRSAAFSAFSPKLSSFHGLLVACGLCSLPALKVQRSACLYCSPSLVKSPSTAYRASAMLRRNNAPGFMPVRPSETCIVAVMVGDLDKRKKVSDLLLAEHGIYVQPIKHPTVRAAIGGRPITPTAYHDGSLTTHSLERLLDVWGRLGFPLRHRVLAEECFGKIRVKRHAKGVSWSAGRSDSLHAASFDICRSTDRKNRVLPAPATLILAISAAEPEGPLLERSSDSEIECCASHV
jgi:hypothetical protein